MNLTADEVVARVAETFGFAVEDILGDSRSKPIVKTRQVAMFCCREFLGMTYPEIGKTMGRDHSTVMHGCKQIREFVNNNDKLLESLRWAVEAAQAVPEGKLKRIHVNQFTIKANAKNGTTDPPLSVKMSDQNLYGSRIEILDKSGDVVATLLYQPEKPLSCGARVWISTRSEVRVYSDSETTTGDY